MICGRCQLPMFWDGVLGQWRCDDCRRTVTEDGREW